MSKRKPVILKDGKRELLAEADWVNGGFSRKYIRNDQILTIPIDHQMVIVGDFFILDDAELVLEGTAELAVHH